jgi:hypothetical protein
MIGQDDLGESIADAWRAGANLERAEPRHEFVVALAPLR